MLVVDWLHVSTWCSTVFGWKWVGNLVPNTKYNTCELHTWTNCVRFGLDLWILSLKNVEKCSNGMQTKWRSFTSSIVFCFRALLYLLVWFCLQLPMNAKSHAWFSNVQNVCTELWPYKMDVADVLGCIAVRILSPLCGAWCAFSNTAIFCKINCCTTPLPSWVYPLKVVKKAQFSWRLQQSNIIRLQKAKHHNSSTTVEWRELEATLCFASFIVNELTFLIPWFLVKQVWK